MQFVIKGSHKSLIYSDKDYQSLRTKLLILTARRERRSDPIFCFLEKIKKYQFFSPAKKPIEKIPFFSIRESKAIRGRLNSFLKICKGDKTRKNIIELVEFLTRAINNRRRVYIYDNYAVALGKSA